MTRDCDRQVIASDDEGVCDRQVIASDDEGDSVTVR